MPDVTLVKTIIHDGDKYQAGEVLRDLTEKQAERLIRLKVATIGETITIKPATDSDSEPVARILPPEKAEVIKKMRRKAEVISALTEAGIDADETEKLDDLKDRLAEAWAEPASESSRNVLSAEEEEEINSMSREELLLQLPDAGVQVTGQETEEELRVKLKDAWSADRQAGT